MLNRQSRGPNFPKHQGASTSLQRSIEASIAYLGKFQALVYEDLE